MNDFLAERALDQADFIDRPPGQFPRPAPEARFL